MKNNDNITKDVESISYDEALNANQEIGNLIAKLQKAQADNLSFVEQIRGFKMIEKVECPYCGKDINVDTDNWYDEDEAYEHQCKECGKYCMVSTSVSWSHDAKKLDCKNGLAERNMTVKCTICEKELSSTEGYLIMELRKSSVDYTRSHYCYTCYQDLCIDDSVRRLVGVQESRKGVKRENAD